MWKVRRQNSFSEQLAQQFLVTIGSIESRMTCYTSYIYNFDWKVQIQRYHGVLNHHSVIGILELCTKRGRIWCLVEF